MICPACEYNNYAGSDWCAWCWTDLTQQDTPPCYDRVERSLLEDPVRILLPRLAVTLPPEATVGEAMDVLLDHDIGAIPIVDGSGRLLGILSERDLLLWGEMGEEGAVDRFAEEPVSAYMTAAPESVRLTDSLALVLNKLDVGGYRHLPVIGAGGGVAGGSAEGRVLGMISVRDMLRHVVRLCRQGG